MPRKKTTKRSDGCYEYKGTVGTDANGRPIRKSFYSSKSKLDAKKKWEAYCLESRMTQQYGASDIAQSRTFASWAAEWLEVYKRPAVDVSSYHNTYKPEVDRLIRYFGSAQLTSIRALDVQKYFNQAQSMSMSRLKKQKFILSAIFESAIENELCCKNPTKHIVLTSTATPRPRRALSDDQIRQLISLAEGKRDEVVLMLLTGIRRGEMLGLIWTDYDPAKKELRIQRSMIQLDGQIVANPPKWDSYRTLPLSEDAAAVIERQQKSSMFIFPTRSGGAQDPRSWSQKYKRFAKTLPEDLQVTPHELRHTYGTQLRRKGVDIYTIQKLLGHKSIDVTTEIYVHAETNSLRSALEHAAQA